MILTITKPTALASKEDINSSLDVLNYVKKNLGIIGKTYHVNSNLSIDFGLMLILRNNEIGSLASLDKNLVGLKNIPFSIHAPYNYDAPKDWYKKDLSSKNFKKEGLNSLIKIIKFADRIGAYSISIHPNAIRTKEYLKNRQLYSQGVQDICLERVIENVFNAQSYAKHVSIDLENKPLPATTFDNELPIFTITMSPFSHLEYYVQKGGKLTFDTCHYGIAMKTINGAIEEVGKITEDYLKEREMVGYFSRDYIKQPTIENAMVKLGNSINHIHLNDGSIYRPVLKTGIPDNTKRLPKIGGFQLWWEGYVPGVGELCKTNVFIPWLKKYQHEKKRVFLTLEVGEFDRNYKKSPRSKQSLISAGKEILFEMSQ